MVALNDFAILLKAFWASSGVLPHIKSISSIKDIKGFDNVKYVVNCITNTNPIRPVQFIGYSDSKCIKFSCGGEYGLFVTDQKGSNIKDTIDIMLQFLTGIAEVGTKEFTFQQFTFYVNLMKYFEIDRTDTHIPYMEKLVIKSDIMSLVSKMDGLGITAKYTTVMHKYPSLF